MDNVCHTLVGAACGEAGLKRLTRFGSATLMITANLPDIDVFVFATSVPSVAFRRGWTHGIVAQLVLPILFAALMMAIDRVRPSRDPAERARWGMLLLLSYVGVLSHVGLDLLNNYGVRLLMPFSNRWFYGDTLFIVDPWLWAVLGAGIWLARQRGPAKAGPHESGVRPARVALVVSAIYIAAMFVSARAARHEVIEAWRQERRIEPQRLMVGPVLADPFHKQVIVDRGDGYERGSFSWFSRTLQIEEGIIPKRLDLPAVDMAKRDPKVQALLLWARFPYYEIETARWGSRVIVSDLRFGRFVAATSVTVK